MFEKIFKAIQRRGKTIEETVPSRNLKAIARHVETHLGSDLVVMHEIVSSVIHVDVYVIRPSAERDYWTLLTSGMSDLDMKIPDELPLSPMMELAICLPSHWPLDGTDPRWKQPNFFWPIAELKRTAMYPHLCETWLTVGHSIEPADGDLAGDRFAGHLVRPLQILPKGFEELTSDDGRTIGIYAMCPLLPAEMQFKLNHGYKALEEKLMQAGVTELLDPARPSTCPVQ
jgi:Suppressor of fused protein (SUFU)